jgi:hypothetical protein
MVIIQVPHYYSKQIPYFIMNNLHYFNNNNIVHINYIFTLFSNKDHVFYVSNKKYVFEVYKLLYYLDKRCIVD